LLHLYRAFLGTQSALHIHTYPTYISLLVERRQWFSKPI